MACKLQPSSAPLLGTVKPFVDVLVNVTGVPTHSISGESKLTSGGVTNEAAKIEPGVEPQADAIS